MTSTASLNFPALVIPYTSSVSGNQDARTSLSQIIVNTKAES